VSDYKVGDKIYVTNLEGTLYNKNFFNKFPSDRFMTISEMRKDGLFVCHSYNTDNWYLTSRNFRKLTKLDKALQ
jgi:hypothetical protein